MGSPNLLFVFPDQMRGQAMGFTGEEPVRTPHLDRFAGESLVLDQAVSNYPVCSPYRAMLMTGKYPFGSGVIINCTSYSARYDVELRQGARCWSDVLKERGYSLGYIGKWHLDAPRPPYVNTKNNMPTSAWNEWCPPARRHGFDFWYSCGCYDSHLRPMYWRTDAARDAFHYVDQWSPEHEADVAIAYLRNAGGAHRDPARPFALAVSMNPPHMPYDEVPERYLAPYAGVELNDLCVRDNIPPAATKWGDYYRRHIRNYYAMITGVDEQFGRILRALAEEGLASDTIVVFTSDHGDCLGIHDEISKGNHYEESLRVPFLIRWPGRIASGRDDLLLSAPDLYPTLLDLMGFRADIPGDVEGVSHAGLLLGQGGPRPAAQLCMSIPVENPAGGWRAVRTHSHTLCVQRPADSAEQVLLHDHARDPFQLRNVAGAEPAVVRDLSFVMGEMLVATRDPWIAQK